MKQKFLFTSILIGLGIFCVFCAVPVGASENDRTVQSVFTDRPASDLSQVIGRQIFSGSRVRRGTGISLQTGSGTLRSRLPVKKNMSIRETMKEVWKGVTARVHDERIRTGTYGNIYGLIEKISPAACTAVEKIQQGGFALSDEDFDLLWSACSREYPCFLSRNRVMWAVPSQCWEKWDRVVKLLCFISEPELDKEAPPPLFCRSFIKRPGVNLTKLERCVAGERMSCWREFANDPKEYLAMCRSGNFKYRKALDECVGIEGTFEPDERRLPAQVVNNIVTKLANQKYVEVKARVKGISGSIIEEVESLIEEHDRQRRGR